MALFPNPLLSHFQSLWSSLIIIVISVLTIFRVLISHLISNLSEMLANKPKFRWIHKLVKEMNNEIACIRLGNVHVIPVTCPTIARELLRKQDATFASRPISISTDIISNGYLTTALVPFGEQWKKMKKIMINDLLSTTKHQRLQHKRVEEADNLMFYVYNMCKNDNLVNVRIAARHYCCSVIKKLFLNTRYFGKGGKYGGPSSEDAEHLDALFTMLKHIYAFCVSDYIPCLRGLDLDGHEAKVKEAVRIVNKYHDPIIEQRIKQWNDGSKIDKEDFLIF